MSDENTVTRSLSSLKKGKTDWQRLAAMPEAEVDANARSDGDAPPSAYEEWEEARIVLPASTSVVKGQEKPGVWE